MQEDALLLRRAQKGDSDAFEALIAPHEKKIYALCLRILGNQEDAMDCAQEAMLRIWRSMHGYRKESSFLTWCFRIATNACLDLIRRRKVRPQVSLEGIEQSGFPISDDSGANDPQLRAESAARMELVRKGLAQLSPEMRAALVLRDIHGFSYEDVADIVQAPLGTVKSRINRAREKLRAQLMEEKELFYIRPVYEGERREAGEM